MGGQPLLPCPASQARRNPLSTSHEKWIKPSGCGKPTLSEAWIALKKSADAQQQRTDKVREPLISGLPPFPVFRSLSRSQAFQQTRVPILVIAGAVARIEKKQTPRAFQVNNGTGNLGSLSTGKDSA